MFPPCQIVVLQNLNPLLCQDYGVTYTTHSICALKGSTVELSCTYKYPKKDKVTSTFWFTRKDSRGRFVSLRNDDDYKGRVTYNDGDYKGGVKYKNDGPESHKTTEKRHFLTIRGVRESDSAKYMFRFITRSNAYFGETGVRLSVSGLQVTFPSTVIEGQGVSLTCSPTCPLTDNSKLSYIWYKNGHLLTNEHSDINLHPVIGEADNYSCSVKGREMLRSPEVTLNVRYGPKNTSVSVSSSGEIVEGSSVTLTCSSDANPPVEKYTWYKKTVTSPKASGQSYSITNITSEDRGEYYCEAENEYGSLSSPLVYINIKYGPKNTSVSVSPSGEIVEGSSVTLTCNSDANPPVDKYTWYKKTVNSPKASGQSYNITNIISEDSGEYYCEAENMIGIQKSSIRLISVTGEQTSWRKPVAGITVIVLFLIFCLSGFIWSKRKAFKTTNDTRDISDNGQRQSAHVYEIISDLAVDQTAAQTTDTVKQEDAYYSSVHYRSQDVPLYSTVQLPEAQKQEGQLAAAKLNHPSAPN
uniref:B-cell receptor CD22 n=1 Tax=Esox lucius TaxID=8010 RepID=A0AAY5KE27_ESOLU